jgi:hypothetical protein
MWFWTDIEMLFGMCERHMNPITLHESQIEFRNFSTKWFSNQIRHYTCNNTGRAQASVTFSSMTTLGGVTRFVHWQWSLRHAKCRSNSTTLPMHAIKRRVRAEVSSRAARPQGQNCRVTHMLMAYTPCSESGPTIDLNVKAASVLN